MVDDATAAYIVENRKCFEDLKQVASQLAGLLVLSATGSKKLCPIIPCSARLASFIAKRAMHCGEPAQLKRARRHYEHLAAAATLLGVALQETSGALNVDRVLIPLRAGYTELERAADALPGFEKVAYERACCVGARA